MRTGRLLFPAVRWDDEHDFDRSRDVIDVALERGVGGFILFDGVADAVKSLVTELRERSDAPLLIGADLERGAGQQFRGATPLPPVAALGALDDLAATRRAGELTAREARALGIDWVYAPVADLDVEPRNPIVGTRAFGADADRVADHVAAWIQGCHDGGALACAKHFPGHGRTVSDSHMELPHVDTPRGRLEAEDMAPFRAAIDGGVDSIMTAHVAYPTLDPSGSPATLSAPILTGILRRRLGFDGLIVTDALIMAGVLEEVGDEGAAALRAVRAGCDALLYPRDVAAVADRLDRAIGDELPEEAVAAAIGRIDRAAERVAADGAREWGDPADRAWALELARRSLRVARGEPRCTAATVDVVTIDDDEGGPAPPPPRDVFPAALREAGLTVTEVDAVRADRAAVVALYADIRAWKGRPGISQAARAAVSRALNVRRDAPVVLFGHPRLVPDVPAGAVLTAWGGEALMQEAAGRALAAAPPPG